MPNRGGGNSSLGANGSQCKLEQPFSYSNMCWETRLVPGTEKHRGSLKPPIHPPSLAALSTCWPQALSMQ